MAAGAKTKGKPKTKARRGGGKPATVDAFLAALPADKRSALQKLRRIIRAAAPKAEEAIGYGIPGFRVDGKWVVWIGAGANHCALYGVMDEFLDDLEGYDVSGRGTVRFTPDHPLPAGLVSKIVKGRIAANAARKKNRA